MGLADAGPIRSGRDVADRLEGGPAWPPRRRRSGALQRPESAGGDSERNGKRLVS